jgi:hypothetical protein
VLMSDGSGNLSWVTPGGLAGGTAWSLSGNGGTTAGTNFIGTTDGVDFVTMTNNTERMRVSSAGMVGVGTSSPNTSVDIDGGFSIRPGAISITTDNQAVTVGNRSFLRLTSDNTPANRTVVLSNGLQDGQMLVIRVVGNGSSMFGVEIVNGSNISLSGNVLLDNNSILSLIWDNGKWYEVSRSFNN